MDLETIKIFLEIKNRRSISEAASALSLSQCTVSRRLAMLEKELDVNLFYRSRGQTNVTLSDAGEAFLQIAEKMTMLFQEAQCLKFRVPRVRVSVAILDSIYTYLLKDCFSNFLCNHPEYIITLAIQHSWEVHDLLEKREANIGVTNNASPYADMLSKLLFSEEFVVIQKKSENNKAIQWVHPRDLPPEHEIHQSFDPSYNIWHDYWWRPHQAKCHVSIATLGIQFFNSENDWAIVPYSIAHYVRQFGFTISRLYDAPPRRDCYLILPKYIEPHTKDCIDVVSDMMVECVNKQIHEQTKSFELL